MNFRVVFGSLLLGCVGLTAPGSAAPAPQIRAKTVNDLAPLPLPYDTRANAARQVAAARKAAIARKKLLLVDFGGNWCLDCRILAAVMERPEMRPFMAKHFELVTVDIGRFDKNMAIPASYGFKKLEGVPALLVVEPRTNKVLNRDRVLALADARTMTPQGLADWLASWTK